MNVQHRKLPQIFVSYFLCPATTQVNHTATQICSNVPPARLILIKMLTNFNLIIFFACVWIPLLPVSGIESVRSHFQCVSISKEKNSRCRLNPKYFPLLCRCNQFEMTNSTIVLHFHTLLHSTVHKRVEIFCLQHYTASFEFYCVRDEWENKCHSYGVGSRFLFSLLVLRRLFIKAENTGCWQQECFQVVGNNLYVANETICNKK